LKYQPNPAFSDETNRTQLLFGSTWATVPSTSSFTLRCFAIYFFISDSFGSSCPCTWCYEKNSAKA